MYEYNPGDDVVCVDDRIKPEFIIEAANYFPNWVKKGTKYRVRAFIDNDGIAPAVLLQEISNPEVFIPLLGRMQEPAFATWRFAPATIVQDEAEHAETESLILEH